MQPPSPRRALRRRDPPRRKPAAPAPADVDPKAEQQARLIEGMATALTEKGYADISVADIVQHARVSKRTFYENFADKEACYLATYAALSDDVLARIAAAGESDRPAEERLVAATRAYLTALEERPALTRTYLTEIQAAGPEALKLRRSIHARFADLLQHLVERSRKERPLLRAISPLMAAAIVGGINELVLLTIEEGRAQQLQEIGPTVVELLAAVLLAPPISGRRQVNLLRGRRTG
ncbi:MAG TPA: TetR/AcrR family transcriptional regulator [Polyangiaceae bacterium]|nr:TetR/AcrR family transcriptional regulator [Polyangiaceae bacterium]